MAKLDLKQAVLNLDGKEVIGQDGKTLDVRTAIKISLLNDPNLDKKSGVEKYNIYKLAMKIESENPDFTTEELASIKKAVGDVLNPIALGFIWDLIEAAK